MGRPKTSMIAGYDDQGTPIHYKTSQQEYKGQIVTFSHCFYCDYKNQNPANIRKHILNVWPCKRKNTIVKEVKTQKKQWIEVKGMTRSQVEEIKSSLPVSLRTGDSSQMKPKQNTIKKKSPHKKEWIEIKGLTREQVNQLTSPEVSDEVTSSYSRQSPPSKVYKIQSSPQKSQVPQKPRILNFQLSQGSLSSNPRLKIVSVVTLEEINE